MGIELETDWYGKAKMVKAFKTLPNGKKSPAKKTGEIEIGDSLIGVDGIDVENMTFVETLDVLAKCLVRTFESKAFFNCLLTFLLFPVWVVKRFI